MKGSISSGSSSEHRGSLPIGMRLLPGVVVGILLGLLISPIGGGQVRVPAADKSDRRHPDLSTLSPGETEALAKEALRSILEKEGIVVADTLVNPGIRSGQGDIDMRRVNRGLENLRRLLPLARRLTIESIREADSRGALRASAQSRERRLINGARRIVLDQEAGGSASVYDDRLSEIHIDVDYAPDVASDDEAIFLLGHELTHVAARSKGFDRFIETVTGLARLTAQVEPTRDQKEDLACDFIGEQVLKRFIALRPTDEPGSTRIARIIGFDPEPERIARAFRDFCQAYNGDRGDEQHLSEALTLRALVGLDPELKGLMPEESVITSLCR